MKTHQLSLTSEQILILFEMGEFCGNFLHSLHKGEESLPPSFNKVMGIQYLIERELIDEGDVESDRLPRTILEESILDCPYLERSFSSLPEFLKADFMAPYKNFYLPSSEV